MPNSYSLRTLTALLLILAFFVGLALLLLVTDLSFSVWEHLQQQPPFLFWGYIVGLVLLSLLFGRILWRVLLPRKRPQSTPDKTPPSISREQLEQRIETAREQGMDIDQARRELSALGESEQPEAVHIAMFGEISSGKSSLIHALLPDAEVETGVVGGTTRELQYHRWDNELGMPLILVDMPGLNEQDATLDSMSQAEMARAHLVLFVVEGDLTADQFDSLQMVVDYAKPCVLVLNKADRYQPQELEQLLARLEERAASLLDQHPETKIEVVPASAGGVKEVTLLLPDGSSQLHSRHQKPDLAALQSTVQRLLQNYSANELEALRRKAVMRLVWQQLDQQQVAFRRQRSEQLVKSHTRKAVVAALATVSPGTDLLVQGYLGVSMVQDLCRLYQVPADDIDIQKLLKRATRDRDKTLPLLLAIAGNGLKAFPGAGTLAGGLMHAVAYGLIFDALGSAVAKTLELQGELAPVFTDRIYKEKLGENVEKRARDIIRVALEARQEKGPAAGN